MRALTWGTLFALLVASGCSTSSEDSSPADSTAEIDSCEELADRQITITQEYLDAFGAGSFDEGFPDEPSDEMADIANAWGTGMGEIGERAQSLGCVDLGSLVCERQLILDPKGDAGIAFVHDNTPCNLEGTFGPGSEEETRYQAWQDAEAGEGDPSAPEGDGSDGSATTSVGLGATSCVELADLAVDVHQRVLDAMGGETFDGELPPEVAEALDRAQLFMSQLPLEVEACAGGFEEFDELRCDRVQELQTFGLEPIFLEDLFPPCPADGT